MRNLERIIYLDPFPANVCLSLNAFQCDCRLRESINALIHNAPKWSDTL